MTKNREQLTKHLEEKLKITKRAANNSRKERERANANTKKHTTERNKLNGEVMELVKDAKSFKAERDKNNNLVREKKIIRKALSEKLKSTKTTDWTSENREENKLRILRLKSKKQILEDTLKAETFSLEDQIMAKDELDDIEKIIKRINKFGHLYEDAFRHQELAHNEVQEAATLAQKAHEDMLEINTEIDKKRELAETAHRKLRRSKKEADSYHHKFILALNVEKNCKDMLSAIKSKGGEVVDNAA
jgi:uncharacterized coiled-coil DUF342 family protein